MTRSERIAELFGDAAELHGSGRAAFLDRECGEDAEMRREIEGLLRHDPGPLDVTVPASASGARRRDALTTASPEARFVGRFEIERVLGEGGMGVVYLARDPTLSRHVAVKLLKGGCLPAGRGRLMREAHALARITHANVVAVFDVGIEGAAVWIAMEYVQGGTLHAWLKSPRSSREIIQMFLQAGGGLAAAHRAGLLHRDFKPQNVLVGDDGRARVVDFGLARRAGEAPNGAAVGLHEPGGWSSLDLELTGAGDLMGTPGYMSPEHFEGNIGPASDQWSFAASLYRALFRQSPFAGTSLAEIRQAVLEGTAQPPPASDVSVEIEALILRGLSRHPEDRHASLDDLLGRIAEVVQRDPEQDRTRFARQRRAAIGLTSLLALLNLLGAGVRTDFRYDLGPGDVLLQGVIGLIVLTTGWWFFRKTAFRTSHNRKVLLLLFLTLAAMCGHRLDAQFAGIAVVDVLRLDAITGIAFLVYGAIFLERWLWRAAGLVAAQLAVSHLWPRATIPTFGVTMVGILVIATWSWPAPSARLTPSPRSRRSGSATSSSSSL